VSWKRMAWISGKKWSCSLAKRIRSRVPSSDCVSMLLRDPVTSTLRANRRSWLERYGVALTGPALPGQGYGSGGPSFFWHSLSPWIPRARSRPIGFFAPQRDISRLRRTNLPQGFRSIQILGNSECRGSDDPDGLTGSRQGKAAAGKGCRAFVPGKPRRAASAAHGHSQQRPGP